MKRSVTIELPETAVERAECAAANSGQALEAWLGARITAELLPERNPAPNSNDANWLAACDECAESIEGEFDSHADVQAFRDRKVRTA